MEFCSIASGSSGNSVFIGSDHSAVLVDAGISARRIVNALSGIGHSLQDLKGILVTHEHADHISALGVLSRKAKIPIYATAGTIRKIKSYKSLGAIDEDLFHEIKSDEPFSLGDLQIFPFRISHDAAEPVAYRVEGDGKAAAVATDMGCFDHDIVSHLQNLDTVLLESNHDKNMLEVGPYPYPLKMRILGPRGHLSNESAAALLCEILNDHMKGIYLGHLSKENNYAALAYATVTCAVTENGACPYKGDDLPIQVASRDHPMELLRF
jgi:phosphoribosyl 1,2-cyclic phosphodiesterase